MQNKPENPPAFPEHVFQRIGDIAEGNCKKGMTLRDYFATAAMQSNICIDNKIPKGTPAHEFFASQFYKMADAMLKARQS